MKFSKIILLTSVTLVAYSLTSGCNRKKDTIAKVFVYDQSKTAVSGCQVILKAEPSESSSKPLIEADTAITNATGEAIFNFNDLYQKGQAGVAVLNIYASKDGSTGTGVIQIIEEETSESDIYLN